MWCEAVDWIHLAQVTGQWRIYEHGNESKFFIHQLMHK